MAVSEATLLRWRAEYGAVDRNAVRRMKELEKESMNSRITRIKAMACKYRNRERVRNAVLFHLGGLDLYPVPVPVRATS
jgi:transposase